MPPADPTPPRKRYLGDRTPSWLAPPLNEIPATVALNAVWVHHKDLAVYLPYAAVYRCGVDIAIVELNSASGPARPFPWVRGASGPRLQVELADGQRLDPRVALRDAEVTQRPDRPIVRQRAGGGHTAMSMLHLWVWPLPGPGPLAVVGDWPEEAIPQTRVQLDGDILTVAAAQARRAWPDDRAAWEPPPSA